MVEQTDGKAQKLPVQGLVNAVVRVLLCLPVVSRGVGRHLITLYVVGRKSGRKYTIPVAYTEHDGALLIGTPFAWARNLRTGEPVSVRHQGRPRTADVRVLTAEAEVVEAYEVIARHNHNFAQFNKIAIDPDGNPDPADLRRAWTLGARVLVLTLR